MWTLVNRLVAHSGSAGYKLTQADRALSSHNRKGLGELLENTPNPLFVLRCSCHGVGRTLANFDGFCRNASYTRATGVAEISCARIRCGRSALALPHPTPYPLRLRGDRRATSCPLRPFSRVFADSSSLSAVGGGSCRLTRDRHRMNTSPPSHFWPVIAPSVVRHRPATLLTPL